MKIRGLFKTDMGFVNAHVISESASIDKTIEFLVDTGSSRTVILDKDALLLDIDYNKLGKPQQDLGGIGGSVKTDIIEHAILVFETDEREIELRLPVFVLRHGLEEMPEEEQIKILRIPSILGRDVINRFRLIFDKAIHEVIAERSEQKEELVFEKRAIV